MCLQLNTFVFSVTAAVTLQINKHAETCPEFFPHQATKQTNKNSQSFVGYILIKEKLKNTLHTHIHTKTHTHQIKAFNAKIINAKNHLMQKKSLSCLLHRWECGFLFVFFIDLGCFLHRLGAFSAQMGVFCAKLFLLLLLFA